MTWVAWLLAWLLATIWLVLLWNEFRQEPPDYKEDDERHI